MVSVIPVNTTATQNANFSKFRIVSEDFQRFPGDFPKTYSDLMMIFRRFCNNFQSLLNISKGFPNDIDNFQKHCNPCKTAINSKFPDDTSNLSFNCTCAIEDLIMQYSGKYS